MNRRALIVGATGLIGGHLLQRLADHPAYSQVSTLGRRAPKFNHEKVTHHVADISGNLDENAMPAADVLFCCLGTTIKQAGSQAAFRAVDFDLVVQIATQAHVDGARSMVVVSSVGADLDSSNFYLRTKGEMERAVGDIGFDRLGIMRPSLLLGSRNESRPAERLGQYAARLVNPLMLGGLARYRAVDAQTVAGAMVGFDLAGAEGLQVIEGKDIWRLAGH